RTRCPRFLRGPPLPCRRAGRPRTARPTALRRTSHRRRLDPTTALCDLLAPSHHPRQAAHPALGRGVHAAGDLPDRRPGRLPQRGRGATPGPQNRSRGLSGRAAVPVRPDRRRLPPAAVIHRPAPRGRTYLQPRVRPLPPIATAGEDAAMKTWTLTITGSGRFTERTIIGAGHNTERARAQLWAAAA